MSAHSHRPADPRAASTVLWSALLGLFIALLTLALSPLVRDGFQRGIADGLGAVVTTALIAWPFLLALIALRWSNIALAKATWLRCGLVALGMGLMLFASGIGVFLFAAGAGLIAAWWISRWR